MPPPPPVFVNCPMCHNECLHVDGICAGSPSVATVDEVEQEIRNFTEDILRYLGFVSDDSNNFMAGRLSLNPAKDPPKPAARLSKGSRLHPYNNAGMRKFGYFCPELKPPLPIKKRFRVNTKGSFYTFDVNAFVRHASRRYNLRVDVFDAGSVCASLKTVFFRPVE